MKRDLKCLSVVIKALATSWINAGQALRRAQDLGLHVSNCSRSDRYLHAFLQRSPRRLQLSALEKEIRRRVWWCVYGLDRVLSMCLGRPSGASDDDCDTELRKAASFKA